MLYRRHLALLIAERIVNMMVLLLKISLKYLRRATQFPLDRTHLTFSQLCAEVAIPNSEVYIKCVDNSANT